MRKLSGVMVGVAIATALVPPLSTVGFGLVTGRMDFALGAALLFLTNTLAIAFAATIVARTTPFGQSLTPQNRAMTAPGLKRQRVGAGIRGASRLDHRVTRS